jgi:iron-sulfur cluster assembly protein
MFHRPHPDPPGADEGESRGKLRGNIASVIEQEAAVSLTPEAQSHLKDLLAKEGNPQLALRIFVSGGGCSGMQYGMAFDDNRRPDDLVIEQDGVQMVVDDYSANYIRGSQIDYVDSLMGAGFTVHNPNAVHSCSCGTSFNTGDDAGEAKACGCGH